MGMTLAAAILRYGQETKRKLAKRNRERPIIGDRCKPSALGDIQPDHWLAEYTSELLNVLHVLGGLIQLEPNQADLLGLICSSELIGATEFIDAGAIEVPPAWRKALSKNSGLPLFADHD